jgi:hypothetical protein
MGPYLSLLFVCFDDNKPLGKESMENVIKEKESEFGTSAMQIKVKGGCGI